MPYDVYFQEDAEQFSLGHLLTPPQIRAAYFVDEPHILQIIEISVELSIKQRRLGLMMLQCIAAELADNSSDS